MTCRSAAAYEGAAARGMTCEGAAARGTKHARWRSGRGGVRAATEHARWQNFTILYARADKTRLFGKIRLFCTLGQGFRLVFSTLEANLAKSSVPTVHFSVISPESPTFRAQAYKIVKFRHVKAIYSGRMATNSPFSASSPLAKLAEEGSPHFVRTLKRTAAPKSRCLSN